MSANGEAPFFNAPDLTQRDGTLAGPPQDTFADPLSGLVTTSDQPAVAGPLSARPLAIPGPVPHDPEVVQRMVDAALDEPPAGPPDLIPPAGTSDLGNKIPLGMLPRQRTWPTRPPQLLRPIRRAPESAEAAEEFAEDGEEIPAPRRRRKLPSVSMPALGRPSSSAAGVMLAVVLLIVFGVVAIEMVSSLVSSVTGLFH